MSNVDLSSRLPSLPRNHNPVSLIDFEWARAIGGEASAKPPELAQCRIRVGD
jgi:hypothetical protein